MATTGDESMFNEILEEMREHALKRLTDRDLGIYVPSQRLQQYYLHIKSLPVSHDDELDDGVDQIKALASSWASDIKDCSNSDLTDATNTLKSTRNQAQFLARMEQSRQKSLASSAQAINATYDKAEELAGDGGTDQGDILGDYRELEASLMYVSDNINDFLNTIVVWGENWPIVEPFVGPKFYNDLAIYIENNF
jgi:hypothetical protein